MYITMQLVLPLTRKYISNYNSIGRGYNKKRATKTFCVIEFL